jgi:hypothetical protein
MMETYEEVERQAQLARQKAKSTRNDWKDRTKLADRGARQRRDEAFGEAIDNIRKVIDALRIHAGEESPYRRAAEREIGHCLGVIGGTYRDWEKYEDAARAYDDGWPYELNVIDHGGQPDSYCLVQRLVARVLLNPAGFFRAEPIMGINVQAELERAADVVTGQIGKNHPGGKRFYDPWAQADLAMILQLMESRAGSGFARSNASHAWDRLIYELRPKRFVYDSTKEVVELLSESLRPYLDNKSQQAWTDVLRCLS